MRSDLVFQAVAQVSNRYRLCKSAFKATRKFHRPNTRLPETINDVLIRFHESDHVADVANEISVGHPLERHHAA